MLPLKAKILPVHRILKYCYNHVKTGYSFAGWNTKADGSGTTYAQGQTFKMGPANVTLYALWTEYAYVANYGGNTVSQYTIGAGGALTPMTPATVAAGSNPASIITR